MTMQFWQSRRSFMSALTSLAGVAAIDVAASPAAAQSSPTAAPGWDFKWMDDLKAKHKQVFDLGEVNLVADPRPLRFPRNYLDTFHDVFALDFPEVRTIVGISGPAFAINASDRLWEKYALGERSKIIDPATKQPAIRNVFLNEESLGVKALQARGTIFWQCNIALNNISQQLATARQLAVADVRADLLAGLNPGVRLVPSHVMAMGMVQERGVTYVRI